MCRRIDILLKMKLEKGELNFVSFSGVKGLHFCGMALDNLL